MTQQTSPFLEAKYGWNYGESGWNTGMDENLTKFSFLFDKNIDGIVSSLPSVVNGTAYFLTTDNRIYFGVSGAWYSTPTPKWFTLILRSSGASYQFNGTALTAVANNTDLSSQLQAIQVTLSSLGTAAFQNTEYFASNSELDVASAQANSYTDSLRTDLATQAAPTLGSTLVGYRNRTVYSRLNDQVQYADYPSLQAALSTGKRVWIPSSVTSITLDAAAVTAALPLLNMIDVETDLTIIVPDGTFTFTSGNIVNVGQNGKITLTGSTPASTTLVSVNSVTGTSGNYTVVYNVSSSSGMVVGDYLKLDNVVPLLPLAGDQSVFRKRVSQNEILQCSALLGNITANTGGGSAAWTSIASGVLTDYISVGDLLTIRGQTREITSVSTLSVGISGAWTLGTTGSRGWRLTRPNTGTIGTGGVSSSTVTGTSSLFTTEANLGDYLLCDGVMSTITAINSATSITVSPAVVIANGTKYSIITPGVSHQGTFEITAVSGNQVTVKSGWRGPYSPPINKISGGEVKTIKVVLKNTSSGDGVFFSCGSNLKWIDNMVLVNTTGSTGTHGIAINGRTPEGPTQTGPVNNFQAGAGFALIGWGRGVFAGIGCSAQLRKSHILNSTAFGVWALEGTNVALRECVVGSTLGRGAQLNSGSTSIITASWFQGNTSDNINIVAGATAYGEIIVVYGAGVMGVRNDGANFDAPEGFYGSCTGSGYFSTGSATATLSRALIVGNARNNIEISENSLVAVVETTSVGSLGTTGSGFGITATDCILSGLGLNSYGNASTAVSLSGPFSCMNTPAAFLSNVSYSQLSRAVLTGSKLSSTVGITVASGATVLADSITPTPGISGVARFDEYAINGAMISTGSAATAYGINTLRVNGGALLTKVLTASQVASFGTVAANSSTSITITVTGASVGDVVTVSSVSGLSVDGIIMDAAVTATNTVTVRAQNRTGAGIVSNPTLRVVVISAA
jgi:hypothetical protein